MQYSVEFLPLAQESVFDLRSVDPNLNNFFTRLGVTEPVEQNRLIMVDDLEILMLGPRRALIRSALENEPRIERRLADCVSGVEGMGVFNVSDLYLGFRISGTDALDVLAHAVPFNLHELSPGHGSSTAVFSLYGIVIRDAEDSFRVHVDRSCLDYVWNRIHACGIK